MTLKNKIHIHYWSQIFKQKLNETSLKSLIKPNLKKIKIEQTNE